MFYKCISVEEHQTWLTVGTVMYEGELAVLPDVKESYIYLKKADDGHSAYVPSRQMIAIGDYKTNE